MLLQKLQRKFISRDGGTGRRTGLKIPRLQGRAGSIPALGTKLKRLTFVGRFYLVLGAC